MGQEAFDGLQGHGNPLGVHFMAGNFFAFHRFESAGADVQCELVAFDAALVKGAQHLFRKMQTGCGGCHRTLDF